MKQVMKKLAMVVAMLLISGSAQAAIVYSDIYAPSETLNHRTEGTVNIGGMYLVEANRELSGSFEGWNLDGYTDITATLTFVWQDDDYALDFHNANFDIKWGGPADPTDNGIYYQEQALVTLDGAVVLNNEVEIDLDMSSYDLILTDLGVLDDGVINYLIQADNPETGSQDFILNSIALTIEGTPSAVPVPGAVWLLGSGLMAVAGLRRRTN